MSQGNTEQIERHFHYHGRHGGGNRSGGHATRLKKYKNQAERRKGKRFVEDDEGEINTPESTYGKYLGWEY